MLLFIPGKLPNYNSKESLFRKYLYTFLTRSKVSGTKNKRMS